MAIMIDIGYKKLMTRHGDFKIEAYFDGDDEAIVLKSDSDRPNATKYCRVQYECLRHFISCSDCCDCEENVSKSLDLIKREGGIFILIKRGKKGLISMFKNSSNHITDLKIVYDIIKNCGCNNLLLLTLNINKYKTLYEYSERDNNSITLERTWFDGQCMLMDKKFDRLCRRINEGILYKPLSDRKEKYVLVIGDLNVDIRYDEDFNGNKKLIGGSGYNAWNAFGDYPGYISVLYGNVGIDNEGVEIHKEIVKKSGFVDDKLKCAFIGSSEGCKTGCVQVYRKDNNTMSYTYDANNANDYNIDELKKLLRLIEFKKEDYIHISSYLFVQKDYDIDACKNFFNIFNDIDVDKMPRIIFDIATYSIVRRWDSGGDFAVDQIREIFRAFQGKIYALIGEYNVLKSLVSNGKDWQHYNGGNIDVSILKKPYNMVEYLVCRYGEESVVHQKVLKMMPFGEVFTDDEPIAAYRLSKIGYGDQMTVKVLGKMN